MCIGGGSSGPSSADLVAQEKAAQDRAKVEIDRINAEREQEKEQQNTKVVSDQAAIANADAARRAKNRTLLAGIMNEEDETPLEDPKSAASKKARRATLIGGI